MGVQALCEVFRTHLVFLHFPCNLLNEQLQVRSVPCTLLVDVFELLCPLLLLLIEGLVEGLDGVSEVTLEFIRHPKLLLIEIHLYLSDQGFDVGDGPILRLSSKQLTLRCGGQ